MHSWRRCPARPDGDIRPEAILSTSFGSSRTATHQVTCTCQIWISGWILPHFDVRTISVASKLKKLQIFGNSFICPTRSGTTEIYIFGPAGAGIQNKICNIHLIDIVLQVQKYLEVQVFLVLQKYLEYQKQWNCSKLSERDTDMQNNIVKFRQRVRQG